MAEWHEDMSDEEFNKAMDYLFNKYLAEHNGCPDKLEPSDNTVWQGVNWNAELSRLLQENRGDTKC